MTLIAFALSFQSLSGDLPDHDTVLFTEDASEAKYLAPMTSVFRQAFRAVFNKGRAFAVSRSSIEIPSGSVTIVSCFAFSANGKGRGDGDTPDRLIIALAEVTPGEKGIDAAGLWLANFRSLNSKTELLRKSGLGTLLDCCSSEQKRKIGHTSSPFAYEAKGRERTIAAVFGFHVLGWINALRIERRQMSLELAPIAEMSNGQSLAIADQRMRIINQERYFLAGDRTNDRDLRAFSESLSLKYRIRERMDRALKLHEAFEHHLDNSSKLYSARQLGSVSNLILILTILSVPISAFSALFAINLNSEAMIRPIDVIADYRVWIALIVGALWVAGPFIVLKLTDRIRQSLSA